MSAVIIKSYLVAINEARRAYRTAHNKYWAALQLSRKSRLNWRRQRLQIRSAWLSKVCDQKKERFEELHQKFTPILRRYMATIGVPKIYWGEFRAMPGPNDDVIVFCGGGPGGRLRERTCLVISLDGTWHVERNPLHNLLAVSLA